MRRAMAWAIVGCWCLMPNFRSNRARIERIGVPLRQEDLWKEAIRAADTDKPDQTRYMNMPGFDTPAAS
jgi:hypothetical protein